MTMVTKPFSGIKNINLEYENKVDHSLESLGGQIVGNDLLGVFLPGEESDVTKEGF